MTRLLRCRNPQCREVLGERYGADRLVVPHGARLERTGVAVFVVMCPECGQAVRWFGRVARDEERDAA